MKHQAGRSAKPQICRIAAFLMAMILLAGCSGTASSDIRIVKPLSSSELFKIGDEVCTVKEAMVLISAQKKVVEEVYGEEIWTVETDGVTFEENMKNSLKDFLARLKCLELMAEDRDIQISDSDKALISRCTETYLSQLTEEEQTSLGIDEEAVEDMFTAYYYSNQLTDAITSDMDTEISDDEARIVQAEYIFIADSETDPTDQLNRIRQAFLSSGDFLSAASDEGITDVKTESISRDQLPAEVETAVFALSDDGISEVIAASDGYYLIHCLEDYDREATAEHKSEMIQEMKESYFAEEYDSFVENLTAQFNENAWEQISLTDMIAPSEADFFAIYEEILG